LNRGDKSVHPLVHFIEVERLVISYVDRLSAKPPTKLGDIRNRHMIQGPEKILVERDRPFPQADLDAVRQKLILAIQVLLLNPITELSIFFLEYEYGQASRAVDNLGRFQHADAVDRLSGRLLRDPRSFRSVAIDETGALLLQLVLGQHHVLCVLQQSPELRTFWRSLERGLPFGHRDSPLRRVKSIPHVTPQTGNGPLTFR
jgi:hypothetical protein